MAFPVVSTDFKEVIPDPTSTLCGNFVKALLKLPVLIYKFVNYIIDGDGALTTAFKALIVDLTFQAGDIKLSGRTPADGWLSCDGSPVSRVTYAALFAAIGETFGPGDAVNTFNVPDFRDNYAMGKSSTRNAGDKILDANYKVKLLVNHLPRHQHYLGVGAGTTVPSENGKITTDGSGVTYEAGTATTKAALTLTGEPDIPAAADQEDIILPKPPTLVCYFHIKT